MRHTLAATVAAVVALVCFVPAPAQAATTPPLVPPYELGVTTRSAIGTTTTCDGVTFVAVSGQLTDTATMRSLSPLRVTYIRYTTPEAVTLVSQFDPTKTVTMSGYSHRVDLFYRYVW